MKLFFSAYAWAVEFGRGCRSLILEEPVAIDRAVRQHGTVKQLYELVEVPDDEAPPAGAIPACVPAKEVP